MCKNNECKSVKKEKHKSDDPPGVNMPPETEMSPAQLG